jgi:hypothetical protein
LKGLPDGFAVQEDNAALEFNIQPYKSIRHFQEGVYAALIHIKNLLPAGVAYDTENSSLVFDEKYLQIPSLQTFGCEPDYNAFTMETNDRPIPKCPGFRTAAAHVHIGWENPSDDDRLELVRLADVFVSMPSVFSQGAPDLERRTLYGKAGAFRPKPYGVEHRVLGNSWIFKRSKIKETLRAYTKAIAALNAGVKVKPDDYKPITEAINSGNKDAILDITKRYNTHLNKVLGPDHIWDMYYGIFQ